MNDDRAATLLAAQRGATTARIESLRRLLGELADQQALTTHDDEHDPEGVTIGYHRAELQSLLTAARAELAAVAAAEHRLEAGTYGTCERCGRPIADDRLAALPTATRCLPCTLRRR